jgi:hypothetical protein
MATISEIEKLAFDLSESERAVLASHLLRSLPAALPDEVDGIDEARSRDAELDSNPEASITLDQLDSLVLENTSQQLR